MTGIVQTLNNNNQENSLKIKCRTCEIVQTRECLKNGECRWCDPNPVPCDGTWILVINSLAAAILFFSFPPLGTIIQPALIATTFLAVSSEEEESKAAGSFRKLPRCQLCEQCVWNVRLLFFFLTNKTTCFSAFGKRERESIRRWGFIINPSLISIPDEGTWRHSTMQLFTSSSGLRFVFCLASSSTTTSWSNEVNEMRRKGRELVEKVTHTHIPQ